MKNMRGEKIEVYCYDGNLKMKTLIDLFNQNERFLEDKICEYIVEGTHCNMMGFCVVSNFRREKRKFKVGARWS
jgi:hypothetical protein